MIRKTFILLLICFTSFGINAQWYSNSYGVEELNALTDVQLMESYSGAKVSSIVGGVVTGTGIVLMISGIAKAGGNLGMTFLYATVGADYEPESTGGGLLIGGTVLTLAGTAFWHAGGSRKKQLRPIIKSRGLATNISVYPGAGYELVTNTYYPAVTIRIEF